MQLAMPPGGEGAARAFYGGLLGLAEVEKPPDLAPRGGCWFETGHVRVHLGVEEDFRPTRKAHIAFRARGLAGLVAQARRLGLAVEQTQRPDGSRQAYLFDPFGNRLEFREVSGKPQGRGLTGPVGPARRGARTPLRSTTS